MEIPDRRQSLSLDEYGFTGERRRFYLGFGYVDILKHRLTQLENPASPPHRWVQKFQYSSHLAQPNYPRFRIRCHRQDLRLATADPDEVPPDKQGYPQTYRQNKNHHQ